MRKRVPNNYPMERWFRADCRTAEHEMTVKQNLKTKDFDFSVPVLVRPPRLGRVKKIQLIETLAGPRRVCR